MKEIIKELSGWLLYIVLIIALTWTVVTFVGQRTEVSGSSMETTLSDKDQLIVDKMTYRFRDPKRYDIDRKSTRLNSSHITRSRMPSSA